MKIIFNTLLFIDPVSTHYSSISNHATSDLFCVLYYFSFVFCCPMRIFVSNISLDRYRQPARSLPSTELAAKLSPEDWPGEKDEDGDAELSSRSWRCCYCCAQWGRWNSSCLGGSASSELFCADG